MRKKLFWFFFVLILILSAALRFAFLGDVPVSPYWDETAILVDARSIAETGRDVYGHYWLQAIFSSYGDFKLPVYIWLASASVKIFGATVWSIRLPSVLAGLGTVLVGGALARLLIPSRSLKQRQILQLIVMAVIGFSPWSVMFSRTGFEGHVAQFFLLVSVMCMLLMTKNKMFVVLAGVFGAIATYTYFSVLFVWFGVLISYWLFLVLGSRLLPKDLSVDGPANQSQRPQGAKWFVGITRSLLIGVGLPAITYLLCMQFLFRSPLYAQMNQFRLSSASILTGEYALQSNVLRQMSGNTLLSRVMYHRQVLLARQLLKNYSSSLSVDYLFLTGDANLRHGTGRSGLFLWVLAPFLLIGLIKLFQNSKATWGFVICWWLLALLPASVPLEVPHALRSLNALMPIAFIISYGLLRSYLYCQSIFGSGSKVMRGFILSGAVALGLVATANMFIFLHQYFVVYPAHSAYDWQKDYLDLSRAVYSTTAISPLPMHILPFDGRFYLWLLAFGTTPSAELQRLHAQTGQFYPLGHITLAPFRGWTEEGLHSVLLAGWPDQTKEVAREWGGHLRRLQTVPPTSGTTPLVIDELTCQVYRVKDVLVCDKVVD